MIDPGRAPVMHPLSVFWLFPKERIDSFKKDILLRLYLLTMSRACSLKNQVVVGSSSVAVT